MNKNIGNARATLKATDLYRLLTNNIPRSLTSTRRGSTNDTTNKAYSEIQARSADRHKAINMAICKMLSDQIPLIEIDSIRYEVDAGEGNLLTDVIIPINGEELYLEFHHLSPNHCKAYKMSSYIMEKLQSYAIHYNLVPR